MQRLMTLFAMLMLVVMTGCVNRGNLRVERAGDGWELCSDDGLPRCADGVSDHGGRDQ